MLEIPECITVARQLNQKVQGKTIRCVHAAASPHRFAFYCGDPGEYPKLLTGKTVGGSIAVSGYIETEAGDVRLLFNDGDNLRYLQPGEKRPQKHQLLLEFDDESALVCTVQMYGAILAFPEGTLENPYYTVAKEKPSPLSEGFTEDYFLRMWEEAKPSLSIKALLATEQRIPGLGNGVLQDILFYARVHPQSRLSALSGEQSNLYQSVRRTLSEMTERGGRDIEKDLFGNPGGYPTVLSSKSWKTQACPVCGGAILRKAFLGGNVYFCPACQPLKQ